MNHIVNDVMNANNTQILFTLNLVYCKMEIVLVKILIILVKKKQNKLILQII